MEISLHDLARMVHGTLEGSPGDLAIRGVNGLRDAQPGEITFLANPKYAPLVPKTNASAIVVGLEGPAGSLPAIRVRNPDLAFAKIVEAFAPAPRARVPGIHPSAVIGNGVRLGHNVQIGPNVVIGDGAEVGDQTVLCAAVYVGDETRIGRECLLYPGAVVRERILVGDRVILHCGAVIGADGFGYSQVDGVHRKIPQVGTVQIDDDVEIGANVTVDRARFGKTWIRNGTKIDNLVHIAHNVVVGEHCLVIAQSGIAGSARVGKNVIIAPQAGLHGHIEIGDGAVIAARSVVTKDVGAGQVVSGSPAGPLAKHQKLQALVRKLPQLFAAVKEIKERMGLLDKTATHHRQGNHV